MKTSTLKNISTWYLPLVIFLISSITPTEAQVVIQRCDVTTGWQGAESLFIDDTDQVEGRGALATEAQTGVSPWFYKTFSQTQTGVSASGYLSFWLFVSDVSQMEGGQIEVSSSGGPDAEEYNWPLDGTTLNDGWNHLQLQISSATTSGGAADLDRINFFRIYQDLSAPITAKIDFIRFSPTEEAPTWPVLNVPEVDNTTLDGKVMFGYQGWFNHPADNAGLGWIHWGNFHEPINSTVDMYPDMREYGLDEQYDTDLTFSNGRMAPVFSSHNRNTVVRHMKWVRDYNLDGVFLQRFISEVTDGAKMDHKDTVTTHIVEGCEKYDRVFAIMYDGVANRVEEIKADWMHLVDDLEVTESDRYLNHRDRPLVALWGYTVREEATVDQLVELIDWFKNNPDPKYRASLLLGVAWDWYDQTSDWMNAFQDVEVISPWFSGDTDYDTGQAWCDANDVDFLPVVHPGFSWHNLYGDPQNATPREGGNFFWNNVNEVVSKNAKSVYIAMFDEVDEGTAMFKLAETQAMTPQQGYWLPLNADGFSLPSDWYLRAAGLASEVVRGYENNHTNLITPPEGIMTIRITNEVNGDGQGAMEFIFPDFPDGSSLEISIDGGETYPYSTPDDVGSYIISGLSTDTFDVVVRHEASAPTVDMGEVLIANAIELPPGPAEIPFPADGASDVRIDVTVGWTEGQYVQWHDIYFDTLTPPELVATQANQTYFHGELSPNTTYYWRVDGANAFGEAPGPIWSFTTTSDAATDTIVLDYCDSNGGWTSHNGLSIDAENKQEGFASLVSEGAGTVWFEKTFNTPLNTYCDTSSYLDLWVYISDISSFDNDAGGQIEITSSGGPDEDEYNWPIADLDLSNGWNPLHLKIGDADKIGNPNLQAINFFRLYQFVTEPVITRVDYIIFTGLAAIPLSIPEGLTATGGDGFVMLDWADNPEPTLGGYNLYRTNIPGVAPFNLVNPTPITESTYTDFDVNNGSSYFYILSAVDTLGFESEVTEMVSALPEGSTSVDLSTDQSLVKVFPNPVNDGEITVALGSMQGEVQLSIRNMNGWPVHQQTIKGATTTEISIESIPRGAYIISVSNGNKMATSKLIIR